MRFHHNDVILAPWSPRLSSLDCLLNCFFGLIIPKLRITVPLWRKPPLTGGFPSQIGPVIQELCPFDDVIIRVRNEFFLENITAYLHFNVPNSETAKFISSAQLMKSPTYSPNDVALTHWPLRNVAVILRANFKFQTHYTEENLDSHGECHRNLLMKSQQCLG